jgi:phospholipase C
MVESRPSEWKGLQVRFRLRFVMYPALALCAIVAMSVAQPTARSQGVTAPAPALAGIHKIQHVIIIMQENRSFDTYFGVYPGADGIPMKSGKPTVCNPDPLTGKCVAPFVDHKDQNPGAPHRNADSIADVDGGKMDGFVADAAKRCSSASHCAADQVMGYHTRSDIPNYWAYAKNFALDDHMFESVAAWSFSSHLALVSAWAAKCPDPTNPMSCKTDIEPRDRTDNVPEPFAWTDLTYLLHKNHISWGYYLDHGEQSTTNPNGVPKIWNVMPGFTDVSSDNQAGNVKPLNDFMNQAQKGTLPAVSWIVPDQQDSEHPSALVSTGQAYVTKIINAVMQSSAWSSSAIFLAWDDWGGFYDNVVPPVADSLGYGIRVPALVISPYAKNGYIDPQTLSFDAYLKFIEDDFLGGQRIDPATDGRPDSRPGVRESLSMLGSLQKDFNFSQAPRPPMTLNPCPPNTTLTPKPPSTCNKQVRLPKHAPAS